MRKYLLGTAAITGVVLAAVAISHQEHEVVNEVPGPTVVEAYEAKIEEIRAIAQKQQEIEASVDSLIGRIDGLQLGQVVAFDGKACPEGAGWQPFEPLMGRVIVGAGYSENNRDEKNRTLTRREYEQRGGEERHALAVAEIPSHAHAYKDVFTSQENDRWVRENYTAQERIPVKLGLGGGGYDRGNVGLQFSRKTSGEGGKEPHNIMQPFFVLTYCRFEGLRDG